MNSENESVVKGILKYSISTWVNLVVGFLYVIISTRILNPEDYGLIVIFLSMSSLIMSVIAFGMDGALIRFYNTPPEGNTKPQLLYNNMVLTTLVGVILGCVCTFGFGSSISLAIFDTDNYRLVGLVFIYAIVLLILRFLNISFRMSFRAKQYNIQNILMNCLTKVLIICAALLYNQYVFILSFLTLGSLLLLTYYLHIQRREFLPIGSDNHLKLSLNLKNYSAYFRFALFSAPTYIIVFLNTFLSQQIVNVKMDAYSLGIFASTGLFSSILVALQGGFSTYWSAYIYKNYKDEKEKISFIHDYVVLFSILMAALLVIFRDAIYLFIGVDYHESKAFYSLLLVLPIFNFVRETTEKGIAIANKNEISMIINIIAVVTNLGLSYWLIGLWGLKGAALANAISAVVLFIFSTIYGQRYYKCINNYKKTILGISAIFLILLIPSLSNSFAHIIAITFVLVLLSCIIYCKECIFAFHYVKANVNKLCIKK